MSTAQAARPRPAHWHPGRQHVCHHAARAFARDDRERSTIPALPLRWDELPERGNTCALSVCGPYVISHRPGRYTLSFRPPGQHHHVATRSTLHAAKVAAAGHAETLHQQASAAAA